MTSSKTDARSPLAAAAGLFEHEPPFTSVYLETTGDTHDASDRLDLRWRSTRRELTELGTSAQILDEMEGRVQGAHTRGNTLVLLADASRLRQVVSLPMAPALEVIAVRGPAPRLTPLARHAQLQLPAVAVAMDRVGAEVVAMLPHTDDLSMSVEGDDLHITRSSPGGWSQRRFQQRAEDQWESNARLVAEHLAALVDQMGPRVVVVSGDVRAVQFLRDTAPKRVQELLHEVQGEYHGTDDVVAKASQVVRELVAADLRSHLERLAEELGQGDRAAAGVDDVLAVLVQGQVEVLVLRDDQELLGRPVLAGPGASQVFATAAAAQANGVEDPVEMALGDAAVRAALATGAQVVLVPSGHSAQDHGLPDADESPALGDGVAALLRWSQ